MSRLAECWILALDWGLKQRLHVVGQKRFELSGSRGERQTFVEMSKVGKRVDAVGAAGDGQRVEIRAGACSELSINEQP